MDTGSKNVSLHIRLKLHELGILCMLGKMHTSLLECRSPVSWEVGRYGNLPYAGVYCMEICPTKFVDPTMFVGRLPCFEDSPFIRTKAQACPARNTRAWHSKGVAESGMQSTHASASKKSMLRSTRIFPGVGARAAMTRGLPASGMQSTHS